MVDDRQREQFVGLAARFQRRSFKSTPTLGGGGVGRIRTERQKHQPVPLGTTKRRVQRSGVGFQTDDILRGRRFADPLPV